VGQAHVVALSEIRVEGPKLAEITREKWRHDGSSVDSN